jgi:hypothetical protein
MDNNRELRSMIFSAIHIPPLPTIVCKVDREDNSVTDYDAVESSHSIIGSMMEWSAMANNLASNDTRMKMQCALLSGFKSDLARIDPANCPAEDLYNFYCFHTRAWANTFTTSGDMMRFKPLDYVIKNDKTHQNMRGYTKAQFHLFTDGNEDLELDDSVTYTDLLRKCAQWAKEAYHSDKNSEEKNQVEENRNLQSKDSETNSNDFNNIDSAAPPAVEEVFTDAPEDVE